MYKYTNLKPIYDQSESLNGDARCSIITILLKVQEVYNVFLFCLQT